MKIELAYDLRLEHLEKKFPGTRIVEPVDGAERGRKRTPGSHDASARASN